jgi:hypothetical protein
MGRYSTHTALCALLFLHSAACAADEQTRVAPIELRRDDRIGQLRILIGGREALVYQYGSGVDQPHYYPVRSPSGKLLTVQQTDPYPHHRSVWFANTLQLKGQRTASFYDALYTRVDAKDAKSPFRDRIRHVKFLTAETAAGHAIVKAQLRWEADLGKTPVLDEIREM